jgi:hypothetical protein
MRGVVGSRYGLLAFASALSLCAATAFAQAMAVPGFPFQETERLADGLYAFRQGAYRSIFLVSDKGVIVTDPVNPGYAKAYREEIAKVTSQPVRYVVYSHSHWDRIAGGKIFKDEGAKFVAQKNCAENLTETPSPNIVPPDITYDTNYKVRLGDKELDLYYFGPSLDNCLSVFVARPANMMMVVNIVGPPTANVPWNPTVPDYRLHNLIPFFHAVEDLARRDRVETLIGGFISIGLGSDGKPYLEPSTGPMSVVAEQRVFWEKLISAVKTQMDNGTPTRDIVKKLDLSQFSQYPRYSERSMEILVRRIASLLVTGR